MVAANPGDLDPSFGTGGIVTTTFFGTASGQSANAHAVALQGDGKIVAAGQTASDLSLEPTFALARYNPDGSLDATFGTGGTATTTFGTMGGDAHAVALQRDGKIIAAGNTSAGSQYVFALARYNADGNLDATFGTGGTVTTAFGSAVESDSANAVVLQADGKIVAAGSAQIGTQSFAFGLARYNPDGSLDMTFATSGKTTAAFGGGLDSDAAAVVL